MPTNIPSKIKSDSLDGKVIDAPDIDGELTTDQIADHAVVRNKLSSGVQRSIDEKATEATVTLVDRKVTGLRELAEQNAEKIDALETTTTDSWDAFTQAEIDAGYAFYAQDNTTDPVSNDEFVGPNLEWTFDVAGNEHVWLRVPKGVDPSRVRVELRRGQTVVATHPAAGEVWEVASIRGLTHGFSLQYDYFRLNSDSSDAAIAITGALNDRLGIEIAARSHAIEGYATDAELDAQAARIDATNVELGVQTRRIDLSFTNENEIVNGLNDTRARVEDLEAGGSDTRTQARFASLEDKTSAIGFDEETEWGDVTDPQGATYGRIILVPSGDAVTSYTDGLNATGSNSFAARYTVAANVDNIAFVWVAPNNINWSRVKVQVRSSTGRLRLDLILGSLRTAPATVRSAVSNIPAGPPDRTVLWPAVSDSEPHSLLDLAAGDVITIQALNESHVPVWNGELGSEVSFQLVEDAVLVGSVADGQQLQMYSYGDYRHSNKPSRVPLPQAGNIPGDEIHGVAFNRATGDAYFTYHNDSNDNEQLIQFDPTTGAVLDRGAQGYGKTALNDATLGSGFTPRALTISDDGRQAWLSVGSIQNTTVYTSIHPINLATGVIGAKIHQAVAAEGSTRRQYYGLAITPDGLIACDREDMYRINTVTGARTKLNTARIISGHDVDSIAYSSVWHELVGWAADGNLYRWNPAAATFDRISTDPPLIAGLSVAFYSLAFAVARNALQRALSQTADVSVLIGRTGVLPTSAGTLTASVTIGLTWTPSGSLGVTAGGMVAHPRHELRIPKVLPPRFRHLRIDAEVAGTVVHRFYLPIGGTSDDANDVHSVHDIYISNNQRLETDLEHYRNQPYDGLRIEGAGTSLPANTTIAAYAV